MCKDFLAVDDSFTAPLFMTCFQVVIVENGHAGRRAAAAIEIDAVDPRRHIFDDAFILEPGAFVVVYDGGEHPGVPGSVPATSGTISLNNTGDLAVLSTAEGHVVSSVQWSSSESGVSFNRAVDGDAAADLVLHDSLSAALLSPGTFAP